MINGQGSAFSKKKIKKGWMHPTTKKLFFRPSKQGVKPKWKRGNSRTITERELQTENEKGPSGSRAFTIKNTKERAK